MNNGGEYCRSQNTSLNLSNFLSNGAAAAEGSI